MKLVRGIALVLGVLALGASMTSIATADTLISKPPDYGPWWNPIGNSGTYVYANCFIAPAGPDNTVSTVGTWLEPLGSPNSIVRFEVWGDLGGGPDCHNVIAASDQFSTGTPGLNLHTLPVTSGGGPLTAGGTYWFVVTAAGMGDPTLAPYRVGGHTQGPDGCTFWYSNYADGCTFDGRSLTPEMAFEVLLTAGATAVERASWGTIKAIYR